jgi:hypothetical protein
MTQLAATNATEPTTTLENSQQRFSTARQKKLLRADVSCKTMHIAHAHCYDHSRRVTTEVVNSRSMQRTVNSVNTDVSVRRRQFCESTCAR